MSARLSQGSALRRYTLGFILSACAAGSMRVLSNLCRYQWLMLWAKFFHPYRGLSKLVYRSRYQGDRVTNVYRTHLVRFSLNSLQRE